MRLINPSVEILTLPNYNLKNIFKHIERCGRTCYQSFDKITEDSYVKFVEMIENKGHLSVFEHGTIYLKIPRTAVNLIHSPGIADTLIQNKYTKYRLVGDYYVTTNLRVIIENHLDYLMQYICEPTEHHYKRTTVKFILPIGISREFCRHRVFSFSEQSTRYCNFSLDRFSSEITFIIPDWLSNIPEGWAYYNGHRYSTVGIKEQGQSGIIASPENFENSEEICKFVSILENIERMYIDLIIKKKHKPQEARDILPLSIKSELIMTGFDDDWKQFLELRCSPYAHPDAQKLANMVKNEMDKMDKK